MLQQKRYKEFIEKGDEYIAAWPQNDSLRAFIGQQLIYGGFYDEGYERLYPLFKQAAAPESTRKLVHTEIGYQSYAQKKAFYKKYPAFFADTLEQRLQRQYRKQEGTKLGLTADYASDNFDNTIGRFGSFVEWGNRQRITHQVALEEVYIGSNVNFTDQNNNLIKADYQYKQRWPNKGLQFNGMAGFYYENYRLRPDAGLGIGYGRDSTFTSAQLSWQPVFTNTSINQNINELELAVYREGYGFRNILQTSVSLTGKRYSNDVYSYEALGRLYVQLPFSTSYHRMRVVGELSFSDATTSYTSGIPYYTPDKLLIEGLGVEYRYRDILENPNLSFELELMGKHGNRDGYFISSAARLNARLKKHWELSLNADISSSTVYRYNHVGLTISYILPNYLRASE